MTEYVSRVIQLDALTLDTELYSLIRNQLFRILNEFKVGNWTQKYGPEIQVLIKFVIWRFSVLKKESTIGQTLLGVKYPSNSNGKLKLLFLVDTVVPYLYERFVSAFHSRQFFRKLDKPIKYAEGGLKVIEVANFCIFLMQNRYPTLVNRILKLPFIPARQSVPPSVGYSYQLRELLWHQFADFLMIVLPLINLHRLKRYIKDWGINPFKSTSRDRGLFSAPGIREESNDSVFKCCICKQDAVIPQRLDSCTFCYYCIRANTLADSEYKCLDCLHYEE